MAMRALVSRFKKIGEKKRAKKENALKLQQKAGELSKCRQDLKQLQSALLTTTNYLLSEKEALEQAEKQPKLDDSAKEQKRLESLQKLKGV